MVFVHCSAIATSTWVVLCSVFIAHLPARLATTVLSALSKSFIEIRPDNALVQLGAANVLHAVERILVRVVLDEAESTGRLLEAVEAHYQALDFAALGEEFVDLLLGGVEGEVADVEGCGVFELIFWRC